MSDIWLTPPPPDTLISSSLSVFLALPVWLSWFERRKWTEGREAEEGEGGADLNPARDQGGRSFSSIPCWDLTEIEAGHRQLEEASRSTSPCWPGGETQQQDRWNSVMVAVSWGPHQQKTYPLFSKNQSPYGFSSQHNFTQQKGHGNQCRREYQRRNWNSAKEPPALTDQCTNTGD